MAAPLYSDFVSGVGHAYKSSATKGQNRHVLESLILPLEEAASRVWTGIVAPAPEHGKPIRCQVAETRGKNRNTRPVPFWVDRWEEVFA